MNTLYFQYVLNGMRATLMALFWDIPLSINLGYQDHMIARTHTHTHTQKEPITIKIHFRAVESPSRAIKAVGASTSTILSGRAPPLRHN